MMTLIHKTGSILGNYKLINLLGRGQGGELWAAVNKEGVAIALKCFTPDASVITAESEFHRGKTLNHPNILSPLSFEVIEEAAVITMPLCEGRSVDNIIGYCTEAVAWKLILEIGSALTYLHARNLCHGDVKPSNILWTGKAFLLTDFGSCFESGSGRSAGDSSSFLFAAPDNIKTEKSDIWSLGASVFNLVMGSMVFNGLGGKAQRRDSPIPYMRKSMPELSEFVMSCLSYDPSIRPSASEIVSLAEQNIKRIEDVNIMRPLKQNVLISEADEYGSFWPDKMEDTK
jgi:serine/threonine protein kinase